MGPRFKIKTQTYYENNIPFTKNENNFVPGPKIKFISPKTSKVAFDFAVSNH